MKRSHPKSKIKTMSSSGSQFRELQEEILQVEEIDGNVTRNILVEYLNKDEILEPIEEKNKIIDRLKTERDNLEEKIDKKDFEISKIQKEKERCKLEMYFEFEDEINKALNEVKGENLDILITEIVEDFKRKKYYDEAGVECDQESDEEYLNSFYEYIKGHR